jgi:hypothetical protein
MNSTLGNFKAKNLNDILIALPIERQKNINARAAKLAVQLRVQPFQLPQ